MVAVKDNSKQKDYTKNSFPAKPGNEEKESSKIIYFNLEVLCLQTHHDGFCLLLLQVN